MDIQQNTGFTLSATQTVPSQDEPQPSETSKQEAQKTDKRKKKTKGQTQVKKPRRRYKDDDETLIDQYLQQVRDVKSVLLPFEKYTVVDGSFSKKKFVDGVCELDLHVVGKLRCDANMRYLYTGPKREKGSGRQKTYDGKVDWQDLSRFEYVDTKDGIEVYTLVLNHVSLKDNLKVVVLLDSRKKDKVRYALLFSTDINLSALTLYRYYKAHFQIELSVATFV